MVDIQYLDNERIKLWEEINLLKGALHELSQRSPEDLKTAKQNSKDTSMFRNRAETKLNEINLIQESLSDLLNKMNEHFVNITDKMNKIAGFYNSSIEKSNKIIEIHNEINSSVEEYRKQIDLINADIDICHTNLNNSKILHEKMQEQESNSNNYETKIILLHKRILSISEKITQLHNEIFGYDEEDEDTKSSTHVNGLKDDLESSYDDLNSNFENLENEFDNLKKEKFEEIDDNYTKKVKVFEELQQHITSLLPGAMSAGLSYAYYEKRQDEIEERNKSDIVFIIALITLTLISCIPFALGSFLFFIKGLDIQDIILDTPRIVCATLPLYAPALWLAYSSNRKSNLSKRLIEEYTHKESLSKTFEGLAKQIENLGDDEVSNNLKVKLLYNIVSMSSENPGSLIKGYNKSDHPFMDIIDKSTNLTNALEKLSHLPGIKNIATSLLGKVETHQEEKIQKGLEVNKSLSEDE